MNNDNSQHKTLAVCLIVGSQDKDFYLPFSQFSEFSRKIPVFIYDSSANLKAEDTAKKLFKNFEYRNPRATNSQLVLQALKEIFALGFKKVFFIDCSTSLDSFAFHLLSPACSFLESEHPQVGAIQFWNYNLNFNAAPSNELCYTGDDLYGVCIFKKCWDAIAEQCQAYCDLIADFGPEASEIKKLLSKIPHGELPLSEHYEKHAFGGNSIGWNVLLHRLMISKNFMRVCFSRNRAKRIDYNRKEFEEPTKLELNPSYGSLADKLISRFILNEDRNRLLRKGN